MIDIWNFMCDYADSFWQQTEFSFHIFSVLCSWAITFGFLFGLFLLGSVVFGVLADRLDTYIHKEDQDPT